MVCALFCCSAEDFRVSAGRVQCLPPTMTRGPVSDASHTDVEIAILVTQAGTSLHCDVAIHYYATVLLAQSLQAVHTRLQLHRLQDQPPSRVRCCLNRVAGQKIWGRTYVRGEA